MSQIFGAVRNHHLGVWCCRKLDGFCLVLLLDGGLFLLMLIKVGNIWCCSQISQIFGAVNLEEP
jgi:hypothetical protein